MATTTSTQSCLVCQSHSTGPILAISGYSIVRCRDCGLIYYDPLPTPEEQEAFYEGEWADDDSKYKGEYGDPEHERINRSLNFEPRLAWMAEQGLSGRMLDVGCSVGTFMATALEKGWEVEGCDLGGDACRIATDRTGCPAHRGPLEDLALADGHFDAVHASQVIEHVLDPAGFVRECHRILKPGGGVLIATPVIEPIIFRLTFGLQKAVIPRVSKGRELPFPWALHHPYHIILQTRRSLSLLLEAEGFRIVHTRLVPWQSFYNMNSKWRSYYHLMNGLFALTRSGMNVDILAIKQ